MRERYAQSGKIPQLDRPVRPPRGFTLQKSPLIGAESSGFRQPSSNGFGTGEKQTQLGDASSIPKIFLTSKSSPAPFQSRQRSLARAERVGFDAEPLQHVDVKIAQWRRVVGIEGQVLAVLEATASNEHREILSRVAAAVAKVAAEEDRGAIEQAVTVFLRLLELTEHLTHGLHGFQFDDLELFEFAWILAVVGEIVMSERHTFNRWREAGTGKHNGDKPR